MLSPKTSFTAFVIPELTYCPLRTLSSPLVDHTFFQDDQWEKWHCNQ
jgi:hypothetical protein